MRSNGTQLTIFAGLLALVSCHSALSSTSSPTATTTTTTVADTANSSDHEEADDYVYTATAATALIFTDGVATITSAGLYSVSGTVAGRIVVNTTDTGTVQLLLNGVTITSSDGPAIEVLSNEKVVVIAPYGTTNSLIDAATRSTALADYDAAVYSLADLTLYSEGGTLTVNGRYADGVTSKDGLIVTGTSAAGTLTVTGADDGVTGKDYLAIKGGILNVTSVGDGLKATNADDGSLGWIAISGGTVTVVAGTSGDGDGVQAANDLEITGGSLSVTAGGGSTATLGSTASSKGLKAVYDIEVTAGSVTVNSSDDGFHADATVVLGSLSSSPTVTVTSGADGIQAETSLTVASGTVTVQAVGDGLVGGTTVDVSGGTLDLTTGAASGSSATWGSDLTAALTGSHKGIKSGSTLTVSGGSLTVSSADDCLHSETDAVVSGGTLALKGATYTVGSDPAGGQGIKVADTGTLTVSGGTLTVSKSFEGLSGGHLVVGGGTLRITAADDGLSVSVGTDSMSADDGSTLAITGGYLVVNSAGDGIDVNGSATMSGGTVLVNGPLPAQANAAVDYNGKWVQSGGTLVAVGSSAMAQALSTTSTQCSFLVKFYASNSSGYYAAGKLIRLQTSAGTEVVTFAPAKNFQALVVSAPAIVKGTSYTLNVGGTSTGTATDGLYSTGTYTAGSLYTATITPTSTVTTK